MICFFSFPRIAPVLALALLAWARPTRANACAAACEPFEAAGTTQFVSEDSRGNFELSASGRASPGGRFTGTVVGRNTDPGEVQFAVVTMDFGGDTLTFDTRIRFDRESGTYIGTYSITGGTGEFEGASGAGDLVANTAAGTFTMDGEICR
jgi:hypothetical protein